MKINFTKALGAKMNNKTNNKDIIFLHYTFAKHKQI